MDAAASVIAVVQITEQVLTLCYKYAKGVKDAPADIKRLLDELNNLQAILSGAGALLKGPHKKKLQASQKLCISLKDCETELGRLTTKLLTKSGQLHQQRFSLGRLKWPLENKDVDKTIQSLHKHRETLNASLVIDQTTILLDNFERIEDTERLQILEWISPIRYGNHHLKVSEARTANTCDWLLHRKGFVDWETKDSPAILWLQGSPGAGKTFLTSRVIDHVQEYTSPTVQEGFAFFYCDRNEDARRKPLLVLQSYARQLMTVAGQPDLTQKHVRHIWQESRAKGQDLGFEACKKLILSSINLYDRTTLVLDALDECESTSRARLIEAFKFFKSQATKPLRIFVSSRPDGDIRKLFESLPNIEIRATDNDDDIKKFVIAQIAHHHQWETMRKRLREEILETFMSRSQGMFQWASLQITQLLELKTEGAIRNRLGTLPKDLKSAYDEIYDAIQLGDASEKAIADRAFTWVACAETPLGRDALLDAVRLDPDDITHPTEEISATILLSLCNNLLVLDSQTGVWRFSHLSVREYFETHHWAPVQSQCHAARVSIGLLMQTYKYPIAKSSSSVSRSSVNPAWPKVYVSNLNEDETEGPDSNNDRRSIKTKNVYDRERAFSFYCRHHWVFHVQKHDTQTCDPLLSAALMVFLGSFGESSAQYRRWFDDVVSDIVPQYLSTSIVERGLNNTEPAQCTILFACHFSLFNVLLDWWHGDNLPVSQRNNAGESALSLAASVGCIPICEMLLKAGEDVNRLTGSDFGSALGAAASSGQTDMVAYLIVEGGADVDLVLKDDVAGSALAAAAFMGHIETIRCLVKHGATVDLQLNEGICGSALSAAMYADDERGEEIIDYLVDMGADVNLALPQSRGSALANSIHTGSIKKTKRLIHHDAVVDMLLETGAYGSALGVAAEWGWIPHAELLLLHGANVNLSLVHGDAGSALAFAAQIDDALMIQYLIDHGAEVDQLLKCGSCGSALSCAIQNDNYESVLCLLQNGANANLVLQLGKFGSALVMAAFWGLKQMAETLITYGADVNLRLKTGDYRSALDAAQADIPGDWDDPKDNSRTRDELVQDKARVEKLLLQHGAK